MTERNVQNALGTRNDRDLVWRGGRVAAAHERSKRVARPLRGDTQLAQRDGADTLIRRRDPNQQMNRPDVVVSESHGLVLCERQCNLRLRCEAIAAGWPRNGWATRDERERISALDRGCANGAFRHRTFGAHECPFRCGIAT